VEGLVSIFISSIESEHSLQEDKKGGVNNQPYIYKTKKLSTGLVTVVTFQSSASSFSPEEPGSWNNLALISDGGGHDSTEMYSMVLTGLVKGEEYEVRLRAMNRQGWSVLSASFIFKTASKSSY
jgi:hypothetical protein